MEEACYLPINGGLKCGDGMKPLRHLFQRFGGFKRHVFIRILSTGEETIGIRRWSLNLTCCACLNTEAEDVASF